MVMMETTFHSQTLLKTFLDVLPPSVKFKVMTYQFE